MVSNGAKIHVEDELDSSLLHWAVKENDRSVVDFLLLHGADIDHGLDEYGNYETVLGLAVRACNVSMVEHLISKGATVNSEDQDKSTSGDVTLVELAVLEADNATLTALLRGGANPNILSGCTSSVLGEVMEKEDAYSMVLALLAANADVNLVLKEDGMAPLSSAMFYEDVDSRVEIVHELLKHGADPNARDSDDYTALTSALASKWTDDFLCLRRTAIVRALVKHGANVNHISQGWEDVGKSRRPLLLALSRYNGLVYGDASHDYDRVRKLYDQKVRQLNLNGPPDVAITLTDVPEEGWNNPIVPILLNAGAELWPHMFIKAPEGLCDDDTSD
jgi:ankyrin repeat protein